MPKLHISSKFGIAPNELLNDENISLKAKGLFTYMQSKPDNWNFSAKKIKVQNRDGEDSIKSALKELEKFGYLSRIPIKNSNGEWHGYDYFLYSKPFSPLGDFPLADNPSTDKPLADNPPTYSKKELSKKEKRKKELDCVSKKEEVSKMKTSLLAKFTI